MPGTNSSENLGRLNSIRFVRSDRVNAMPSLLLVMYCFTSVPSEWTCVSSWLPKSWSGLEEQFLLLTRHRASATSTIVTYSDLLMGQKIHVVRPFLRLRSSL